MSGRILLDQTQLSAVANGDMNLLRRLDRRGLIVAPGETAPEFAARLGKLEAALQKLEAELRSSGHCEPAPGITIDSANRISGTIINEALQLTGKLYDVQPDWVPGFFANEKNGALWGGCALSDPASKLTLFIIRKVFKNKRRFLVYDRRELLAHELTHAAHQHVDEWLFEEYFAYRTAKSALRRFFGSCFIGKYDALLFLLPILLLPVVQVLNLTGFVQLPVGVFWGIAAIYPCYLLHRCCRIDKVMRKARSFLHSSGIKNPDAVLFRLTVQEINFLAAGKMIHGNDLRWKLIEERGDFKSHFKQGE